NLFLTRPRRGGPTGVLYRGRARPATGRQPGPERFNGKRPRAGARNGRSSCKHRCGSGVSLSTAWVAHDGLPPARPALPPGGGGGPGWAAGEGGATADRGSPRGPSKLVLGPVGPEVAEDVASRWVRLQARRDRRGNGTGPRPQLPDLRGRDRAVPRPRGRPP